MTGIDPEEDERKSRVIESVVAMFERVISVTDAPDELLEFLSKFKLEIQLATEEVLQIDRDARTRADVQLAVNNFVERMSRRYQVAEGLSEAMMDSMCIFLDVP